MRGTPIDMYGNPSITAQCHTSHDKKIKETKQLKSIYVSSDVAFLYISVGYNSIIISFAEEKAATRGNEMLN